MKRRRIVFLSLLLCFLLILPSSLKVKSPVSVYAQDSELLIRIGVLYSSNAVKTATIASMSGGSAGVVKNLNYTPVFNFDSETEIIANKISGSCQYIGGEYDSLEDCKDALSDLEEFVANGGVTPTPTPTPSPSPSPTPEPTEEPTEVPTEVPTEEPTEVPTEEPSNTSTPEITPEITPELTIDPTIEPTQEATSAEPVMLLTALEEVDMPDVFYVFTGTKWIIATEDISDELSEILEDEYSVNKHTYGGNAIEICADSTRKYILSIDDKTAKVRIEPDEPEEGSEYPALLESVRSSTYSVFYRGAFELHRQSKGNINVINVIDVEEYLLAVVPSEMSSGRVSQYEERIEALKAQAILARTVAYKNIIYDGINSNDVNITTSDQAYKGYMYIDDDYVRVYEASNATAAVKQTTGLVLFYQGEMIDSVLYSDNNGGYTEASTNVWNGSPRDYYQIAEDPWTVASNDDNWTVSFTGESLSDKVVSVVGDSIGKVKFINVLERSAGGKVTKTEIIGTEGTTTVVRGNNRGLLGLKSQQYEYHVPCRLTPLYTENNPGNELTDMAKYIFEGDYYTLRYIGNQYAIIGDNGLPYERIMINPDSEEQILTVSGSGYGHAVGLSQDGALYASENGISCEEIIAFYYPGTYIENLFGE